MKGIKWVCRYAFLGLVFVLSLAWCIYCAITVNQLENTVNSLEYIDLAVQLSPEAVELLDRLDQFEALLQTAIVVTVIAAVCIAGLIAFQVVAGKLKDKKPAVPKKIAAKKEAPAPQPEKKSGFCTNCGQFYEELPAFCVKCGEKIDIS